MAKYKGKDQTAQRSEHARTYLLYMTRNPSADYLEGSEKNSFFSKALMMGRAALLRSSLVSVFCRSGLTVGHAVRELGFLEAMGMITVQNDRGQVAALNHQKEDGHNCLNWHSG